MHSERLTPPPVCQSYWPLCKTFSLLEIMCHLWPGVLRRIKLKGVISLLVDVLLREITVRLPPTFQQSPFHLYCCITFLQHLFLKQIFSFSFAWQIILRAAEELHVDKWSSSKSVFPFQVLFWSPTFFSWSSRGCHCSTWNSPWASTTGKGQPQFGKYALSLKVIAPQPVCLFIPVFV